LVKNSETEISRWRAPISTADTTVAISFFDIKLALAGPSFIRVRGRRRRRYVVPVGVAARAGPGGDEKRSDLAGAQFQVD
jgi:hypothetical protein